MNTGDSGTRTRLLPRHGKPVAVNESLPPVLTAIINTALFALHALPTRQVAAPIALTVDPQECTHFLAWKLLQAGNRAAALLGRPYAVLQKIWLPYTGFEGYFPLQQLSGDRVDAEQALNFEAEFEISTDTAQRRRDLQQLTPAQLVVQQIARIGARELTEIQTLCRGEVDEDEAALAFRSALAGTGLDRRYGMVAVAELSTFFGEVLGELKAYTEKYAAAVDDFRAATYASIVPGLSYSATRDGYARHYTLVVFPPSETVTAVYLTQHELDDYRLMAQIGEFGDPLLRAALRQLPPGWSHAA